jgi:hypothetical protein
MYSRYLWNSKKWKRYIAKHAYLIAEHALYIECRALDQDGWTSQLMQDGCLRLIDCCSIEWAILLTVDGAQQTPIANIQRYELDDTALHGLSLLSTLPLARSHVSAGPELRSQGSICNRHHCQPSCCNWLDRQSGQCCLATAFYSKHADRGSFALTHTHLLWPCVLL